MDQELKNKIDSFMGLCENIGNSFFSNNDEPFQKVVYNDIVWYLIYLTFSDNIIDEKELTFINYYCNTNYTENDCRKWLADKNMFNREIDLPNSLIKLVEADNIYYNETSTVTDYSKTLIEIYKKLGMGIICCDSDLDIEEYKDYNDYISMMEAYVSAALKSENDDV